MSQASRSAHEQLRADHIETLRILQTYKEENIKLKKEREGKNYVAEEDNADIQSANMLLEQSEKISKQDNEIKMLKLRINQSDLELIKFKQGKFNEQQLELNNAIAKAKKRENELCENVFTLELELQKVKQELSTFHLLVNECENLRNINKTLLLNVDAQKSDLKILQRNREDLLVQNLAIREDVKQLEKKIIEKSSFERAQLDQQYSARTADLHKHIESLLGDKLALEKQHHLLIANVGSLQHEVLSLKQSYCDLKQKADKDSELSHRRNNYVARQPAKRDSVFSDSDDDEDDQTFQLTRSNPSKLPNCDTTASIFHKVDASTSTGDDLTVMNDDMSSLYENDEDDDGSVTSNAFTSSTRFQKFLRLKRENKELTRRVAELQALLNDNNSVNSNSNSNCGLFNNNSSGSIKNYSTTSSSSLKTYTIGQHTPFKNKKKHNTSLTPLSGNISNTLSDNSANVSLLPTTTTITTNLLYSNSTNNINIGSNGNNLINSRPSSKSSKNYNGSGSNSYYVSSNNKLSKSRSTSICI